jgi:hypothetical protein
MLNYLKKLKVKDSIYIVKDRKAWYELVQKTKTHKGGGGVVSEEG